MNKSGFAFENNIPSSTLETKETPSQCLELFNLSEQKFSELKNKIKQDNGVIRIFVHPDFEEYSKAEETRKNSADAKKFHILGSAFNRIISTSSSQSPAIIILDSFRPEMLPWGWEYHEFTRALSKDQNYLEKVSDKYGSRKNNIYIVPTRTYSPDPVLLYAENEKEAWGELTDILKKLGVKRIIMGGAELYIPDKSYLEENKIEKSSLMDHLGGCLGKTVTELKDHFKVELSALTFPKGRGDINKFKL